MFIEGFRTDSLYVPGTYVRISQLVGFLCFVGCGIALLVLTILTRKRERLLVLEDAAFEAAQKVEAELNPTTEHETAQPQTDTQKMLDTLSNIWEQITNKVKALFQKQPGEENATDEKESTTEENEDGNKN